MEEAFDAFREIGQGKAEIEIDGQMKLLPNIFAVSANYGHLTYAIEKYVIPKLKRLRNDVAGRDVLERNNEALKFENYDDMMAVTLGLELFNHWDYDVEYCFSKKDGRTLVGNVSPEELATINLEIGAQTKDSGKARWFPIRRALEWMGDKKSEKRREHPRPAGNPITIPFCYPILTAPALDIMGTELSVDQAMVDFIAKEVSKDRPDIEIGVRDGEGNVYKIPKKISLSVEDLVYGDGRLGNNVWVDVLTMPRPMLDTSARFA